MLVLSLVKVAVVVPGICSNEDINNLIDGLLTSVSLTYKPEGKGGTVSVKSMSWISHLNKH